MPTPWLAGWPCVGDKPVRMPEAARRGAAAFATALRAALPQGIHLGQADPARIYPLFPGEDLPAAVPKRLAEFSAGRAAARVALRKPLQALPIGPDRAPVWPLDHVGSITHCAGLCLAIAGRSADFQGIGLDVEPEVALDAALWDQILRPDEAARDGLVALAHFVAKEACYKAQFAVSGQLFDFHRLRLEFSGPWFRAIFTETVLPFHKGHVLQGRIIRAGGYLGAMVALGQPARDT